MLHYLGIACAMLLGAIGTGIGQGIAGIGCLAAIDRQVLGREQSFRALLIGLALSESGAIFSLVIALVLFTGNPATLSLGMGLAELGMGLVIGITAAAAGIASGYTVRFACMAIVRQPFFSQKILTVMLLIQSIIEAPVIFALIIALLIKTIGHNMLPYHEGWKLLGAGLATAFGSIGSLIGSAILAKSACTSLGLNPNAYKRIMPFTLLCLTVIQTPVIFALLISFLLLYITGLSKTLFVAIICNMAAACTMGIGSIGTGIANGFVAAKGCRQIALNTTIYPIILRVTLLSQAVIEASVIYSFIIGLLLIIRG